MAIPGAKGVLSKTEAGKWFVTHWGLLSFCVSMGTISYYLAKGIVKYGAKFKEQLKNKKLAKQIDDLIEESEEVVRETGNAAKRAKRLARTAKQGDIHKSFIENAGLALRAESTSKLISGQTKDYTCVANSLRMALSDFGIIKYENTIAAALKTTEKGANILDIPKALENLYVEEGFQFIARGGTMDKNITLGTLENALKGNNKVSIVGIRAPDIGAHAVVVDKIENGRVFLRDPLPLNEGSYYSISWADFEEVFNDKFVVLKK
ncbi:hypothetical protein GCM10007424_26440 [Flavobacterium suaedae]|uniref:Peptidase C39 domain-containing protein n=1 Tax=Flavobacterium suaedae TaxID=1767027 RepID=A0ABQ1K6I6_9FLAO|nr:cysteine peptidase family C39 domain-containing protein [Flavobacterium suaedae]GGB85104.1 hypothetical protein GCM10007424_26440 [Flavobacterium suaedae]